MLIDVKNLSKRFGDNLVLDNISLQLEQGDRIAILGPSGCGKSTLLREIRDNPEISRNYDSFAFVYQEPRLMPWFSVYENLHRICKDPARAQEMLKAVELWDKRDERPCRLSGGMKQRVAIARALSVRPQLLFLDEPFSALDFALSTRILGQLAGLIERADFLKGVLYVTHNVQEALMLASRVVVLGAPPASIIFDERIDTPLGQRKLDDPALLAMERRITGLFFMP